MARFMSFFTSVGKAVSRKKHQVKVEIQNLSGQRVMVSNEEYSSRYSDSFFVQEDEAYVLYVKPGTLLYIWQQNTMVGDITIPENPGGQLSLHIKAGGRLELR